MNAYSTSIDIEASAETVWGILTDASRWTEWNTTVDKITGNIHLGERVIVHAKIAKGRGFPVKVAELEAPRRMVWLGGMPLGLFTGKRTFEITPNGSGGVSFTMSETFTGLLAPLIVRSMPDLQPAFDEFARCVKQKAKAQVEP